MGRDRARFDALDVSWDSHRAVDELTRSLDVVHKMGFERTTPVQAGTIPRAMRNQDCVVEVSLHS